METAGGMCDGVTPSHNLQTCRRGRYTDDLSPTATHQTNTNPPPKNRCCGCCCSLLSASRVTKRGIRFAHSRLLIMARRASCTRSSGTRQGFLPSILEKVAAPSQHGHQRQSCIARCIVASSLPFPPFHLSTFPCLCVLLLYSLPLPALPRTRPPQQRRGSAASSPPRGARRRITRCVAGDHALVADGAKAQGEGTRNVTAVLYRTVLIAGSRLEACVVAISPPVIGRGKCLGVQLRGRRAEHRGAWRVRLAAARQL